MLKVRNLNNIQEKAKEKNSTTWAISYGDLVTTLLCFFIIFYALEKSLKKREDLDLLNTIKHTTLQSEEPINFVIQSLENIEGLIVNKTSDFIDIAFKDAEFFNLGAIELTQEGKILIDKILQIIKTYDKKYILEIQGHADTIRVKKLKNRWWKSNMELSVQRALSVYQYVAAQNINKEDLIVAGHGSGFGQNKDENFKRRISLRMHLVK